MDFSQIQMNADLDEMKNSDTTTDSTTTHDASHLDSEQAKVAAFIADEHGEDEQNNTSANSKANKKRIFKKLGQYFKNKKSKKKSKNNSVDESISVELDDDDNNNNNDNHELDDADANAMFYAAPPQPVIQSTHNHNMQEQVIMDKVGGDLPWNCEKCTFLNEATELHCTVCFYARFEVKNLPAQWQWKAADRWITYGIPETIEIEEAYKSGAKEVVLTKGWCSSNPSLYHIIFDKQHGSSLVKHKKNKQHKSGGPNDDQHHDFDENATHFYQINKDSGTRREVRRIGTDDDNLFRKLTLAMLDESDRKCMICLSPFTQQEESDGIIVQLSTCKGHGFHKECIAQWVQLKGNCPLCRIDVETQ